MQDLRDLILETKRALEEVKALQEQVQKQGITSKVSQADLTQLKAWSDTLSARSPENTFGSQQRLIENIDHIKKVLELATYAARTFRAEMNIPVTVDTGAIKTGVTPTQTQNQPKAALTYGFPREEVNVSLTDFERRVNVVSEAVDRLRSSGQASGEEIERLSAKLAEAKRLLAEIADKGYLAGDAFKSLGKIAGNLSSFRGANPLGKTLGSLPQPGMGQFFKGKVNIGDELPGVTYRGLFMELEKQRKALAGGAPIRMVDEDATEEIAKLSQTLTDLATKFPATSRSAADMQQVLKDISTSTVVGTEHANKFSEALQKVYQAFVSMSRVPQTGATLGTMRDTALDLSGGADTLFGGMANTQFPSGATPGESNVSVQWKHIGDYKESLRALATEGIDLQAITQDMVRQLAELAEKAGMAAGEIQVLGGTINAADKSFTLAYKSTQDLGGGVTEEYKTSQYFKAAPGGLTATPIFEHGVYDVRVTERAEQRNVNQLAAAVKDMYRKLEQEIRTAATKARGDLGPEAIITDIKPEVNEVTGAIEIVVSAIRKLSDNLSEPAEKVYKLKASLDELAGTATISPAIEKNRSQAIFDLFQGGKAQDTAKKNIDDLLKGTSLSLEKDAQAAYDYNAKLVRLSLSKRNLQGITEQLNITLDKEGNVVNDLRTRYSGFYQAIGQNIVRLTRWAFAANLVYAAMSKLQELPSMLGQMDAAAARMETLTNVQKEQVTGVFDQLFEISRKNAFVFSDTFASSEKALQFTGGDAATAVDLIGDSMVYSKLAAVDLTTAVDTLAAALAQLGMTLDQGDQLMSKWVTLSQQYGVSINDLARTYGAAGSVAMEMLSEDTDLAIDEFNALITVTSRVTTLSSDQLSNFMRTILTNVTSPSSITALRKYGIEVETLGGGYRDFVEILKDVYYYTTMYNASSPQALSDIARALGGGGSKQTSRGQAVIENIPMLIEVLETSKSAATDFDELMASLTDNLQDDINKMNTAFSELLNTMGKEGLMDTFSNLVQLITKVVDAFTSITSATDNAVIRIALMIPQFQMLNSLVGKLDGKKIGDFFSNFSGGMMMWNARTAGLQIIGKIKENVGAAFSGDNKWQSIGMTAGMALLSGLNAYISGKSATTSIVTGLASAIGVAAGLALTGGNAAGAFIGSQLATIIAGAITEGVELGIRNADFRDAFGGTVAAENLSEETLKQIFEENKPQNERDLAKLAIALRGVKGIPASYIEKGVSEEAYYTLFGRATESMMPEVRQTEDLYKVLRDYYMANKAKRVEEIARTGINLSEMDLSARSASRKEDILEAGRYNRQGAFERNLSIIRKRSLMEMLDGKRSLREYREILEQLPTASDPAAVAFDVMAKQIGDMGLSFDEMVDIIATSNTELVAYFSELINQGARYKSMMEDNGTATKEYADTVTEATEVLQMMKRMQQEAAMPQIPAFTNVKDYTRNDFMSKIYPLAREYDQNKLTTYFYANQEQLRIAGFDSANEFVKGVVDGLEPLGLVFKDQFAMIAGISSEGMQFAMQKMQEMMQEESGNFNIQRLKEVGPEKFPEIQKRNRYWLEYIAKLRGMSADQLVEKEGQQFNLVMGEDNVWKQLLSVNEAMNFTLQDILDVEKKQLEGVWNIPEGASFWVPLTSLFYNKGNETNYPDLPPLTATPQTGTQYPTIPFGGRQTPEATFAMAKLGFQDKLQEIMRNVRSELARVGEFFASNLSFEIPKARELNPGDPRDTRSIAPSMRGEKTEPILRDNMEKYIKPVTTPPVHQTAIINLPEPSKITVESTANIQLIMNERVLASIVRTFLARETSRVIKNRTHTATIGKV